MFTSFYKILVLFRVLAILVSASLSTTVAAEELASFLLGGVQVHEPDAEEWARTIDDVGMNTVAVTVYARQGRWDSAELTFAAEEPAVLNEIRAARSRGLKVALILRVAVDHGLDANRFVWHGMIQPLGTEARDEWFRRYTAFVSQWARIAELEGVAVLGIGSELNALTATRPISRWGDAKNYHAYVLYQKRMRRRVMRFADRLDGDHLWVRGAGSHDDAKSYMDERVHRTRSWARRSYLRAEPRRFARIAERRRALRQHWVQLIATARNHYRGHLTYAANFDSYRNVGFWDRLDSIGINAYFSLRKNSLQYDPAEQPAQFDRAWRTVFEEVNRFAAEARIEPKPVLFTELGYTFRRNSTVEPWAHDGFTVVGWGLRPRRLVIWGEQPIDYQERNRALESLDRVRRTDGIPLIGILYWKLSTLVAHEAIEPFVLHIGEDSEDPLQETLLGFLSGEAAAGATPGAAGEGAGDDGAEVRSTTVEINDTGESEGQVPGPSPRQQGHFRNGRKR